MVRFFRDILDGPLYIIVAILSIIFIMAIIGFIMERKKLEKQEKDKIAYVSSRNITQVEQNAEEQNNDLPIFEESFTQVNDELPQDAVFEEPINNFIIEEATNDSDINTFTPIEENDINIYNNTNVEDDEIPVFNPIESQNSEENNKKNSV